MLFYYIILRLEYRIGTDVSAHRGYRIDVGARSDHSAGIEDASASYLDVIGENRAELFDAGLDPLTVVHNRDRRFVALKVRGDSTRAHVRAVTDYRVADIVEMRDLRAVKEYAVFKLRGVADDRTSADESRAADKGTVPDFGILHDYRRACDMRCGRDPCPL